MFSFKWIYFVIFTLILCISKAEISDKRLCIDENCSEIISVGKTLLRYPSSEKYMLSFAPNEDVNVYSYGAGTRPDLVGVEIRGKRGYINKIHFKEVNLIKRPTLTVNTEIVTNKSEVFLEGAAEIKADPTLQPFEIVDGTKIPLDLDSFSTETPVVNSVSEQSSDDTTKPLDSVPNNPNVKEDAPREPTIVNIEQKKNDENQQQQKTEPDNKEDEDTEDDEDDPDDEGDEDNDENEPENKNTEAPIKDSSPNVIPSGNVGDADNVPNVSDNVEKGKEEVLGQDSKEGNGNVPNETPKKVNKENNEQSSQNNESSDNIPMSTADKMQMANEYVKEITENIKKSNAEASQENANLAQANTEGSLPLVNILDALQSPQVEEIKTESFKEQNSAQVNDKIEKPAIDNAENNENILDKNQESKSIKEPPSITLSSTETPLNFEVLPPVNLDLVTPNPVNIEDINNLEENSKNDKGDSSSSVFSLPSELSPEIKEKEGADIKVDEISDGGLFGRLGGILMFNSGGDGEDREVDEESPNSRLDNKDSEVPAESEHNKEPQDPVNTVSIDNIGIPEQSDFFYSNNSEEVQQNTEPEVMENVTGTIKNDDITQNLNSEIPEQINNQETESIEKKAGYSEESGGFLSSIISFFHGEPNEQKIKRDVDNAAYKEDSASSDIDRLEKIDSNEDTNIDTLNDNNAFCDKENCPNSQTLMDERQQKNDSESSSFSADDLQILFIEAFSSDLFLYLTTTALSVIFLVFGMVILDKCRREGPLIARINKLEQRLLTTVKENEMLQEKNMTFVEEKTQLVIETVPNEVVDELNQKLADMHEVKLSLEEQIQALEKELDTSTEVGIELNKIITEMLNSSDGSEIIKENIEQMQKKLLEQQDTINTINDTLNLKDTENHELRLEMEISNRKVTELQSELERLVDKILKIEEERDQQHSLLENEIIVYQTKCKDASSKEQTLNSEIQVLKQQLTKFQRLSEVKVKEYNYLKENLNELKAVKNNKDVLKSLLEVSEIKAQLEQLKSENMKYSENLSKEREANAAYVANMESLTREVKELREKYEKADKEKVEINTKLQVLNNYFKEKEDQMQKEISKYESLWAVKEGEATSTTERIRYMQEELQNYKTQNESLKQEIVNQEVELKSQISVLEKKAHESWVTNRQTERKLEEARQEAAQLRNRLTMRERAIAEGNNQIRMQSPLHQNGELPISPPPLDPTQSPPPLFNPRDHLAKSPPIPGMPPPPFLPPPLGGAPFLPPPPLEGMIPPPMGDIGGMPPPHFMPPPPGMYPGDHRPPPLGRMSSPPPVGGRYSPESTVYSDYDRYNRRSPSPPYDSEYGASPPPIRGYSPYQDRLRDDRREYKRPQARSNGRSSKGMHSSGSENDSLGKLNKKPQRKV